MTNALKRFRSRQASTPQTNDDGEEATIRGRTDIGETSKEQLTKARRGQGIFKNNVRLNEKRCRVTGISQAKHLIASHIKPWSVSTDSEKLDGCNGLLLSPHIDHLFDRGLISFEDDGTVLVSPKLSPTLLKDWGVNVNANVGKFSSKQCEFLQYHRQHRFKH